MDRIQPNNHGAMDNLTASLWVQWQRSLPPNAHQDAVADVFARLVEAYSSSGRYYHTLEHVHQVLATIHTLQNEVHDRVAVDLAAWFHDVVYDTQAHDNEERSADFARNWLQELGVPTATIATATRLILNTKHHQTTADDIDSQVFLDADLAILGADSNRYQTYAIAIRQEYAWVPDVQYREGRQRVLKQFLQRDRLYFTGYMHTLAEQPARANLAAEIASLSSLKSTVSSPQSQVHPQPSVTKRFTTEDDTIAPFECCQK